MLFFQEYRCRKLSKIKNNRTSPVRNSFYCMRIMHVFREKRALSPASRPLSNSADGSLALEAALALTLFLFANFFILPSFSVSDFYSEIIEEKFSVDGAVVLIVK